VASVVAEVVAGVVGSSSVVVSGSVVSVLAHVVAPMTVVVSGSMGTVVAAIVGPSPVVVSGSVVAVAAVVPDAVEPRLVVVSASMVSVVADVVVSGSVVAVVEDVVMSTPAVVSGPLAAWVVDIENFRLPVVDIFMHRSLTASGFYFRLFSSLNLIRSLPSFVRSLFILKINKTLISHGYFLVLPSPLCVWP
jgi:hypothetical protein